MASENRRGDHTDGTVIAGATLAALFLMLHHPTGHSGSGDDGYLLADWSNTLVHGAMIACLMVIAVGLDGVRRRLGEQVLLTRFGALLLGAGFLALSGAAVVNGFAAERLIAQTADNAAREAGGQTLWALNQALTSVGTVLIAGGATAWAPGFWRLGGIGRLSAALGVGLAALAVWWTATDGGFTLTAAVAAMAAFALWSLSVAAVMVVRSKGEPT